MDSYGLQEQFEQAVIHHLCSDKKFFHLFHDFIEPDLLSSNPAKLAVSTIKSIYKDIGDSPGAPAVVLNRANTYVNQGKLDINSYIDLTWYLSEGGHNTNADVIAKELTPILKERARHVLTLKTIEKKQSRSSFKDLSSAIDKLERIGEFVENRAPLSLDDDSLFSALEQMINLNRLPTGADELDLCLTGGVPQGNLAVVIARPGGGKSVWLSQVSAYALAIGKTVAHVVISEIPGEIGGARTLAPIIGKRISDITSNPNAAREAWSAYKANNAVGGYRVFDFASKTSVSTIRETVMGFYKKFNARPDLIAFDYLGLASSNRAPKTANSYVMGEYVTGELRDWAKEESLWIWSAAQSQRMKNGGKSRAIIGLDDIADSYHVVRIADIVASFNTVETDPGQVDGQFFVAKHRVGPSGQLTSAHPVNWDSGLIAPCTRFTGIKRSWELPSYMTVN